MSKYDDLKYKHSVLKEKIRLHKVAVDEMDEQLAEVSRELNGIRNAAINDICCKTDANPICAAFLFDNRAKLRELLATMD